MEHLLSTHFQCENCGATLNPPLNSAGKQTRCACGAIQIIPGINSAVRTGPISIEGQWYIKTVSNDVYGPADFAELREWVAEGRIVNGCSLREPETKQWIDAGHFFPKLTKLASGSTKPIDRAMAETTYGSESSTVEEPPREKNASIPSDTSSPESSPLPKSIPSESATQHHESISPQTVGTIPPSRNILNPPPTTEPHRGLTVLLFGVFGFLLTCPVLSFFAWQFGASDLQKMDAGQMDSTGRELTAAGHLLGKIHMVIFSIAATFLFISFLLAS